MSAPTDQVFTVAQMQAAEQALIDAGSSVSALMDIAGKGAAEWVWRLSGGRAVTVLCGPGNNGGDGWVLAVVIRARGGDVAVISPREPGTAAAQASQSLYRGPIVAPNSLRHGEVFVDCLFGSGLNRALPDETVALLNQLAASHHLAVAVDLPSGVESDSGALLNDGLPAYDLTIALGAWKFAHWTMPAAARMGERRLVEIGCAQVPGAARLLARPRLTVPEAEAHKYSRGLLAVVAGTMPGATLLAAEAALHAGAGYVKLLGEGGAAVSPELVVDDRPLGDSLADRRIATVLAGPGLGRDKPARARLDAVLACEAPRVLDADALMLLRTDDAPLADTVLTPHAGEMAALERAFGLEGDAARRERALALARASGAVVLLKGPDSLVASPDGALVLAPPASSWLSMAGTGDVLAGSLASRLSVPRAPLRAAEEALWLHGEAARRAGPAFSAGQLAAAVQGAVAAQLA
jgi:hydroxyethylthiazole kinase-like uncharacterized protein yjeF